MVSTPWGVLGGVRAAINDRLPSWLEVGRVTVGVKTTDTDRIMDRVRPFWPSSAHVYSLGVVSTILLGLLMLALFAGMSYVVLSGKVEPNTRMHDPVNWILAPGLNDFLPLAATGFILAAVAVAATVHEISHAVAAEQEGVEPNEFGVMLLFGVIPLGAYVTIGSEDDDMADVFKRLPYRAQMRVFAAGILANLVVTLLGLAAFAVVGASFGAVTHAYYGPPGDFTPATNAAVASVGLLANFLFWLVFLNLNLALVNALPVYGLDGGHIFRAAVAGILDSFDVGQPDHYATRATQALSLGLIVILHVWFIVPWLRRLQPSLPDVLTTLLR